MPQAARSPIEALWQLITARTGLGASGSRRLQLEAGLRRAMDRAGIADPAAYLGRVQRDTAALDALVEEVLVGESYFFREPAQARLIQEEILPELRRQASTAEERRPLRIWSAGCAAGEEAYTLAILLEQAGEPDAHLLATDISRRALEQARAARFRAWSLRGLDPEVVQRWFEPTEDGFRVRAPLPARVTFDRLNLVSDDFPGLRSGVWGMDLIVCRNVLIYFDRETVERVAARLWACLAPGGWLLTGSSDPPLQGLAPFEVVTRPGGIFYRRAMGAPAGEVQGATARAPARVGEPAAAGGPLASLPEVHAPLPLPVSAPAPPPPPPSLAQLQARQQAGDWASVDRLAAQLPQLPEAWALRVRALANLRGPGEAAEVCARGLRRHGMAIELHYLMAALRLAQGRDAEALGAARRVVYLDGQVVMGHLMMATLLGRLGDVVAARKACAVAAALARERPADQPVPLGEGITWAALRPSIERQQRALEEPGS